jgi:hypothetical protein
MYFSGILERIREERQRGSSTLSQSDLLWTCFAPVKGVGFMCWLTEGLDDIRSNAKAGKLREFGIQSDAQISGDTFARFGGTYFDISILTVSIQQYYRNPSGILAASGNSSSPGSVSEDWRGRHSAEQALYNSRVRYLPEITFRGYLNGLLRVSDETEEVSDRSELWQDTFSACNASRFNISYTGYSLDDAKSLTSSQRVLQNSGSSTRRNDDRKFVYNDHVLAHASTGMCLAISRQYATRPLMDSITDILDIVVRTKSGKFRSNLSHDDRRNALNGIHLFLDRGYLTLNMVRDFTDLDIGVHGTIKNHWHFHCGNIPNTCTATSC